MFPWEHDLSKKNLKFCLRFLAMHTPFMINAYTCLYMYKRTGLSMNLQYFVGVAGVYVNAIDTGKCMWLYPWHHQQRNGTSSQDQAHRILHFHSTKPRNLQPSRGETFMYMKQFKVMYLYFTGTGWLIWWSLYLGSLTLSWTCTCCFRRRKETIWLNCQNWSMGSESIWSSAGKSKESLCMLCSRCVVYVPDLVMLLFAFTSTSQKRNEIHV